MKKQYFWACMLMAPAFVACSDISLDDVNTDVAVHVNDLVLPLQIDQVKLSTMLDIEDDSKIKVINGEYAVVVDGTFESAAIRVEPIEIKAAAIEGVSDTMKKKRPGASNASKVKHRVDYNDPKAVAEYALSTLTKAVAANADMIHEAVQKLSQITADTHFEYTVSLGEYGGLFDKVNQVHLENFTVQAPRGILFGQLYLTTEGGSKKYEASYDSETGLVSFATQDIVTSDGSLHIVGDITGFNGTVLEEALQDFAASSRGRKADAGEEKGGKSFSYNGEVGINTGGLVVYDTDFVNTDQTIDEMYESLDEEIPFTSQAEMKDIVINSVSGDFQYDVDDVSLEDVKLNDIPDILRESGTDIHLDNPQIYLYLNNTVVDGGGKAVGATAKMKITANDDMGNSKPYDINGSIAVDGIENYLYLSPRDVSDDHKYKDDEHDFRTAKHVPFTALRDVLTSLTEDGGLPTSLNINTYDTHVGATDVQDLALGKDYGLSGSYAFVAPLALSQDSRIKYTDTIDGWAEDTEGIVVRKLALSANATTDVPFEVLLRVFPIDVRGERLGTATDLVLPANAKNAPIEITIAGDIHDLDGVKIDVTATSKEARPLMPDMNISLSGIKVTVSGEYDTKL